jgi:hypothetical protein
VMAEATPSVKVLYVMGQDRTGSTILGNVLGQVDGFAHLGEVRHVWGAGLLREGLCGCGASVRECELWSRAVPEALGGDTTPEEVAGWLGQALRLRNLPRLQRTAPGRMSSVIGADAYASVAARLYPALARRTGGRVLVDTSKSPVYGAILAAVPGLDTWFVHLVRDPRATAYSWQRAKVSPGRPGGRMWRIPAWRSARAWVLANLAADRVRRGNPQRAVLVRYEDFVADPRSTVDRLVRLVGGSGTVQLTDDRIVEIRPQHAASGNPARLLRGPVELREDDEWRTGQRRADRSVVTAITLPLLGRYGYRRRISSGRR